MTDLVRLIAAIDEADAELGAAQNEESAAIRKRELAEAKALALHRALVLVKGEEAKAEAPVERTENFKGETPPREVAAGMIELDFDGVALPVGIDDLGERYTLQFNPRTLRAALNLVAERRRKAGADRAQVPAVPPSAAPVGSEPEIEHPERPDFLTRTRENVA